ncbi:NADAR family protein [Candidatus Shapirobacteria bacterium]|nr:NADAR family protein [Candidatus Shapirobacteria bacterium]
MTITHHQVNQPGPTDKIYFYPKEYYVFDNFSSFQVEWQGVLWPTSEHAFQAVGFFDTAPDVYEKIKLTRSAHDAQKIAHENKDKLPAEWDKINVGIMMDILRHKIDQHPYVLKKLLQSGDREIIEDSWRDPVWGWGEHQDGQNLLGKIWMELRKEYQSKK